MTTLELIELIILAIVVVAGSIYYTIKAIKNGWIKKILNAINTAIKDAESSGKSGKEKKQYVLEYVEQVCKELEIPYNIIKKLISRLIDTIVAHYNVIAK